MPITSEPMMNHTDGSMKSLTASLAGRINPIDDIETINTELALADLESVEKQFLKAEKNAKTAQKEALFVRDTLRKVKAHLDEGLPVRSLELADNERAGLELAARFDEARLNWEAYVRYFLARMGELEGLAFAEAAFRDAFEPDWERGQTLGDLRRAAVIAGLVGVGRGAAGGHDARSDGIAAAGLVAVHAVAQPHDQRACAVQVGLTQFLRPVQVCRTADQQLQQGALFVAAADFPQRNARRGVGQAIEVVHEGVVAHVPVAHLPAQHGRGRRNRVVEVRIRRQVLGGGARVGVAGCQRKQQN